MDSQYFSKEGLEKLKEELSWRTGTLRKEIAARIKEAKEQGDLSENAEYSEAKDAQSTNEGRIQELDALLENAVVISSSSKSGVVNVGSRVKVKTGSDTKEYTIVGASEADPLRGLISNESPLGSAFLGHKKGDKVTVTTPKGTAEYKITEIK
ncbi:MAG TPA: transcription elongation factor GreA [Candidatus Paceibacterota bacterium]|nr:transcription elongation factor GreA [Candidatus Paceibacterota bacterium]